MHAKGTVSVTPLADGRYQLALLCYAGGKPVLAAVGLLSALADGKARAAEEQLRLRKWAQSVANRLQQADSRQATRSGSDPQPGPALAWEVILTLDHQMRHLRTHRDAARYQQRILQAACKLAGVQTLVWVPPEPDGRVVVEGEPCLSAWDCRQLANVLAWLPDGQTATTLFCNNVQAEEWGARYPQVAHLLAFPVPGRAPGGWVLAINKQQDPAGPVPFRRSDAAGRTPFVALLDLHRRASDRYRDLKELLVGLTRALTAAIDAKDAYTFGHSERVVRIAVELGRELNLPDDELSDIYLAGLLHDIGKIGIRDAVLCKPGPLTPEEFQHLKEHPTIGYKILADVRAIHHLLPGVLHHHERYDGKGYPQGLAGEAIALLARILAVADSYDAMSTDRPDRKALPVEQIESILERGAGTQWDARIIQAFRRCRQRVQAIRQRGIGESLRQALDGALNGPGSSRVLPAVP
jgi:HD-GYP domain-containing protein (c-di-GMP phosphodiesterase class II)